jgi:hypothetical protein
LETFFRFRKNNPKIQTEVHKTQKAKENLIFFLKKVMLGASQYLISNYTTEP